MNSQKYRISLIESEPRHVLCEVFVNISIPVAVEFTKAVDAVIEKESLPYLLFDLRGVRNIATGGQNYEFTHKEIGDVKHRRNTVALLVDEDDRSHYFIETIAINSGHRTKLFTDPVAAVDWLRRK